MYYSVGSGYNTSTQACACMYMYVLPNTLHQLHQCLSVEDKYHRLLAIAKYSYGFGDGQKP